MYAVKNDEIYINLFANSSSSILVNNKEVQIAQENNYPWEGNLTFKVNPKSSTMLNVLVRIPGWAMNRAMPSDLYSFSDQSVPKIPISINGKSVDYEIKNGYAVLSRTWKKGDVLQVVLPMDVHKILSNPKLEDNLGRVALQRGPLVYCAEWPDNYGLTSNLILPSNASFTSEYRPDLLQGVTVINSTALAVNVDGITNNVTSKNQSFTAIPYYAWAHRGKGEMMIWLPQKVSGIEILSK
jgi:hypothetical protein